jgi:ribosome biogenesis GTPase
MELREGIVIRSQGGHYYVQSGPGQIVDCAVRGRLKKARVRTDLVATGDRVCWRPMAEGLGVIEEVLPRKSALSRAVGPREGREQVLVANVDQVVMVFSVLNPPFDPLMLDRFLIACGAADLPAVIVANKIDLWPTEGDREAVELYRRIGYEVLFTSALTGEGLEGLWKALAGRLSALTGPSGAGKSSLLNALWPELALEVGEVSEYHDKGKHTTAVAHLLNPEPGTYVADTPGLRQFQLWDVDPEQLEAFFPEMVPYLGQCRFTPCSHRMEPDCAVREAVERGKIAATRYRSYCLLYAAGR